MNEFDSTGFWLPHAQESMAADWGDYPFDSTLIVILHGGLQTDTVHESVMEVKQPEFRRDPVVRPEPMTQWVILPILFSLLLITLGRALYPRRFRQVFLSVLSSNNMNIMMREGNIMGEAISLLLFSNFTLMLGMLMYLSASYLQIDLVPFLLPNYLVFGILFVAIVIFIFVKVLMIQSTGVVFRTETESSEYILNIFLFDYIVGVAMIPFIILAIYPGWNSSLFIAWAVIIFLYGFRAIRSIVIGMRNVKFSPILFLLYLCTLEIIPLLFLAKMLIYSKE